MKLIRFGPTGKEKPGVLDIAGVARDCSAQFVDWNPDFFRDGGLARLRAALANDSSVFPEIPAGARIGACIPRPGKIICIGLNYADHAKEAGMAIPTEPVVFMKASSSFCGPYDPIIVPRYSTKLDWEVELGIIIGADCRYADTFESAMAAVAGFTVVHDVSERAFQLERGGQWTKGKSHDHFSPVGPWLVTPDEVTDLMNLNLVLSVNGVRRQFGNTRSMIFRPAEIVRYLSKFMTLEAGDIILTGTPPGVAAGMKEPAWLKASDIVELSIDGLGLQRQEVIPDEKYFSHAN